MLGCHNNVSSYFSHDLLEVGMSEKVAAALAAIDRSRSDDAGHDFLQHATSYLNSLLLSLGEHKEDFNQLGEPDRLNFIATSLQYLHKHSPDFITDHMIDLLAQRVGETQKCQHAFSWMSTDAHRYILARNKAIVRFELLAEPSDPLACLLVNHPVEEGRSESFKRSLSSLRSPQSVLVLLDYIRAYDVELWQELFGIDSGEGVNEEHLVDILDNIQTSVLEEGFAGRMRLVFLDIERHFRLDLGWSINQRINQRGRDKIDAIQLYRNVDWRPEIAKEILCRELEVYRDRRGLEDDGVAWVGCSKSDKIGAVDGLLAAINGHAKEIDRRYQPALRQGRLGLLIKDWGMVSDMTVDELIDTSSGPDAASGSSEADGGCAASAQGDSRRGSACFFWEDARGRELPQEKHEESLGGVELTGFDKHNG